MTCILLLGSGPNVTACRPWPTAQFDRIVTINNAWAVRPDWHYLVHPSDFPSERQPQTLEPGQSIITADTYVPLQNQFGGFVYAGGTMAFTAAYWTLAALRPSVIAVLGCDMIYPSTTQTHFYGTGTPDPLRDDKTLRSLPAKSARLMILAAMQGCAMVNLSTDESQLVYPRATPQDAAHATPRPYDHKRVAQAQAMEHDLGYFVPSGKYWKQEHAFDADKIDVLDALWLSAI